MWRTTGTFRAVAHGMHILLPAQQLQIFPQIACACIPLCKFSYQACHSKGRSDIIEQQSTPATTTTNNKRNASSSSRKDRYGQCDIRRFCSPVGTASDGAPHRTHSTCESLDATVAATDSVYHQQLVRWLHDNGGSVRNIAIQAQGFGAAEDAADGSDGKGRGGTLGLRCIAPLKAGERLVELPQKLALSETQHPLVARVCEAHVPKELWSVRLALALLHERSKGDASIWDAYIKTLPSHYTVPIFYNSEEIDALQYPPLIAQVNMRCRFLIKFAAEYLEKNADGDEREALRDSLFGSMANSVMARDELGWGMAAASSRAFRVSGRGKSASMLPIIDMANHSFESNAEIRPATNESTSIELIAKRDIATGEFISLNYGALPSDFFLLDYGFVPDANEYDKVDLNFEPTLFATACELAGMQSLAKEDLYGWQAQALQDLMLIGSGAQPKLTIGDSRCFLNCDPRLLAAARIWVSTEKSELLDKTSERLTDETPISIPNEVRALVLLAGLCTHTLNSLPSHAQEDAIKLSASDLTENMRSALTFRLRKKELINRTLAKIVDELRKHTGQRQ